MPRSRELPTPAPLLVLPIAALPPAQLPLAPTLLPVHGPSAALSVSEVV
jgi:hypothetical protein